MRWWLYRIATLVAVASVGAAAMYPYLPCPHPNPNQILGLHVYPPGLIHTLAECGRWHIPVRIEIAFTGILVALVLTLVGARIDRLVLRSRRRRGVGLLSSA